jgi:hypothetical protein
VIFDPGSSVRLKFAKRTTLVPPSRPARTRDNGGKGDTPQVPANLLDQNSASWNQISFCLQKLRAIQCAA